MLMRRQEEVVYIMFDLLSYLLFSFYVTIFLVCL